MAGFHPESISSEIRSKTETNFRKIGINQLKSIIYEVASSGHKEISHILSTKKTKIAQVLGPLIGGNCKTFLLCTLKEGSPYSSAYRFLELMTKAANICVPCVKVAGVPEGDLHFTQFSRKKNQVDERRFPTQPRRESHDLKSQIFSIMRDMEEVPSF